MRMIRYLGRLMKDFMGFAGQNKAWWMVPMVAVLLLLGLLIVITQTAAPAFIYTLF